MGSDFALLIAPHLSALSLVVTGGVAMGVREVRVGLARVGRGILRPGDVSSAAVHQAARRSRGRSKPGRPSDSVGSVGTLVVCAVRAESGDLRGLLSDNW